MKRAHVTFALLAVILGLVAAGCGGDSGEVPSDAVAVVDGTEIPRSELDALMAQAKKSYEAGQQDFPKAGTPEYQGIQQQYVAFLVQKTEFEQAADELGATITEKDVDKAHKEFVASRFEGDEKKLQSALKEQGLSPESFRETLRVSVLSQKIFDAVTKDVTVSDADVLASYTQNQQQYQSPESVEVRHILIAEKGSNGQVDFAKSKTEAVRIYGLLGDGGDMASLARQFSDDEGTKADGGKYTAVRGQSVPEFDRAAFALKKGQISRPVRTTYGYHVIQAISDVEPAKVTPFEQVKEALRASLLQEERNAVMKTWVEDLQERYEGKVSYAGGLAPPELPAETTETTETQ